MMQKLIYVFFILAFGLITGCGDKDSKAESDAAEPTADLQASLADNPLLADWDTPYKIPPFAQISDDDYMPAIEKGIEDLRAEVEAIETNPEAPTFENTIIALETAGETVAKAADVFYNITGTDTNDTLIELRGKISPMLSREADAVSFNNTIWQRVKTIYAQRGTLDLNEQDARLLELTYKRFVRSGAAFDQETKDEISEINARLSELNAKFGENLLKSTKAFVIEVTDPAQLSGLSQGFKDAIKIKDKEAWKLTVDRSVYETFMTHADDRDLRAKMFDGYRLRANSGEYDNGPIAIEMAQLRAKAAELKGYASHAHYILEDNMSKSPQGVEDFLLKVWGPGLARAKQERADMQELMGESGNFAGHDWWYYSEKVRQARYALDENQTKPYFELDAVTQGAFAVSNRLFGISFEEVDIEGWNPVVRSYDVKGPQGEHLGLFMMDMYARESKRGGAWMSSFRPASNINGKLIRPIITNNLNLITPANNQPTLMRFSEVETLFHELGHALHGLMTQIDYPTFSGVDGPRDYTEFPAQILEHWASAPSVLAQYATHYETGEVIPQDLLEKLKAAANHNQGFRTTEYIAASLLDLAWHSLSYEEAMAITDAREFEENVLKGYGLIDEIEPRYRSQYFSHIFSSGYSAGYYAYLWSEILDADGFQAFLDTGDIFDPELAGKLKTWVYESGGLKPADELYRLFRGQDPVIEPLLRMRGLDDANTGG